MGDTVIEIEAGYTDETIVSEIYRNLQVLYATVAGEQALDREYGLDADIQDLPQEQARALLAAEYVKKTQMYEPRAEVVSVEWVPSKHEYGVVLPKVVIKIV